MRALAGLLLLAATTQARFRKTHTWSSWSSWSTGPDGSRNQQYRNTFNTFGKRGNLQNKVQNKISAVQNDSPLARGSRGVTNNVKCHTSCTNGNCETKCTKNGVQVSPEEANYQFNYVSKPQKPSKMQHSRKRVQPVSTSYSSCTYTCKSGQACVKKCSGDGANQIDMNIKRTGNMQQNVHFDFKLRHQQKNPIANIGNGHGCVYPRVIVGSSCRLPAKRAEQKNMCIKVRTNGRRKSMTVTGLISKSECCCGSNSNEDKWGPKKCPRPQSNAQNNLCNAPPATEEPTPAPTPSNSEGGCTDSPYDSGCDSGCSDNSCGPQEVQVSTQPATTEGGCGECDASCGPNDGPTTPGCSGCGAECQTPTPEPPTPTPSNSCDSGCDNGCEDDNSAGCVEPETEYPSTTESPCDSGCDNGCGGQEDGGCGTTEPSCDNGCGSCGDDDGGCPTEQPTTEPPCDGGCDGGCGTDAPGGCPTNEPTPEPTPGCDGGCDSGCDDGGCDGGCETGECQTPEPYPPTTQEPMNEPVTDYPTPPQTPPPTTVNIANTPVTEPYEDDSSGDEQDFSSGDYSPERIRVANQIDCRGDADCELPPADYTGGADQDECSGENCGEPQRVDQDCQDCDVENPESPGGGFDTFLNELNCQDDDCEIAVKDTIGTTEPPPNSVSYPSQTSADSFINGNSGAAQLERRLEYASHQQMIADKRAIPADPLTTPWPATTAEIYAMPLNQEGVCEQNGVGTGKYIVSLGAGQVTKEECCCAAYLNNKGQVDASTAASVNRQFNSQNCPLPKTMAFRRLCPAKMGVAKYIYHNEPRKLKDINECELFEACGMNGNCHNFKKSYQCDCFKNYQFNPISMQCEPTVAVKSCYVGRLDDNRNHISYDNYAMPGFEHVASRNMNTCGRNLGRHSKADCCCGNAFRDLHNLPGSIDPSKGGNDKFSWGSNCRACPKRGSHAYRRLCN